MMIQYENEIENILGEGSIQKINKKRIQDGYEEMNLEVELGVLGFVFETYADVLTGKSLCKDEKTILINLKKSRLIETKIEAKKDIMK